MGKRTTPRTYTDADLADLEVLGVGDLAELLGIPAGSFSTALWRGSRGMSGGIEFPPAHRSLGSCKVWFRTAEVQAAIDKHVG